MQLENALALREGLNDRRGRGLVLAGLGLVETAAANYDAAEPISPMRLTHSGAQATAGVSRAPSGGSPTLPSRAVVSTRPRPD